LNRQLAVLHGYTFLLGFDVNRISNDVSQEECIHIIQDLEGHGIASGNAVVHIRRRLAGFAPCNIDWPARAIKLVNSRAWIGIGANRDFSRRGEIVQLFD
jgi:hypothetical protein